MSIANALKTAREAKGLSQRSLSAKTGVPQGHLSRIESGRVDPRSSSLIEIARALDLELMLVPRFLATSVRGLSHALPQAVRPAYQLDEESTHGGTSRP